MDDKQTIKHKQTNKLSTISSTLLYAWNFHENKIKLIITLLEEDFYSKTNLYENDTFSSITLLLRYLNLYLFMGKENAFLMLQLHIPQVTELKHSNRFNIF